MSPIQQMLLGAGAVATKTYIDDIFSTFLYTGTDTYPKHIVNGIDLAGEGGAVFGKPRTGSYNWTVHDTKQGVQKGLAFNGTGAQYDNTGNQGGSTTRDLTNFNNNGFTLGSAWSASGINPADIDVVSYTLRKCSGFFDCIKFTGTGAQSSSPQSINHSLGSIPGMIIIKNLTQAGQWFVYHTSIGEDKFLQLNKTDAAVGYNGGFKNITSSSFSVFDSNSTNTNEFIAYLFAGGESTAATARSVDFDGNGDYLSFTGIPIGTNDFTLEAWIYPTGGSNYPCILDTRNTDSDTNGLFWGLNSSNRLYLYTDGDRVGGTVNANQWSHVALVRDYSATTTTMYINGISVGSWTSDNINYSNALAQIGFSNTTNTHHYWDGKLSNVRITIGQTLYTSSFRPPTEPLTTTSQGATASNVKLLCCNGSSTTSATVGTITANGNPTASTDSPFDDPAGFVFGDSKEGVIKCGSYVGNGLTDGPEIFLGNGWEPQWVLTKKTNGADDWYITDSMRGLISGDGDKQLRPNSNGAEYDNTNNIDPLSTGFKLTSENGDINGSGDSYIYVAIRCSDGYVGKPPELGTGVFGLGMSNASSTTPCHVTNFITDFGIVKTPASSGSWYTGARLMGLHHLLTDSNAAEANNTDYTWDSNTGFAKGNSTSWQHWAWKRHAGFDVVAYEGEGGTSHFRHSLSKVPEMMWVKRRNTSEHWIVYHKGLNGGSSPEDYYLELNTTDAEATQQVWVETAPTATHFTVGGGSWVNGDGSDYLAMLFSSVDGISKVGYYSGSSSAITVTTGFQPRFLIIRSLSGNYWIVLDSVRGITNKYMRLESSNAQGTYTMLTSVSSSGFVIPASGSVDTVNDGSSNYIYYAHA